MKSLTFLAILLPLLILLHLSGYSQGGWVAQNSGTTRHLFGVYFHNSEIGWVAGENGTILHTTDGGITWMPQNSGVTNILYDVQFASDGVTGWAVGDGNPVEGVIIHTTNGGVTWTRQVSGTPQNLFGTFFISANIGWVVGGALLHTTNGGTTWILQSIASYSALDDIEFLDANTGWIGGNHGDIFHTTDGGSTWTQQASGVTQDLQCPSFPDVQNGWTCGGNHGAGGGQVILHSTDGGLTWNQQTSGTTNNLTDIMFIDQNSGWAVGGWFTDDESIILHTSNGGSTWDVQDLGTTLFLRRVFFTSATTGWAVGYGGTILHTTTGGEPNDPLAQFGVSYGSTGSSEPNNPGALITIDPVTGAGTLIGPTGIIGDGGPAVRALAIKSTGEMYALSYTASSDLYTVNASTGTTTVVANTGLLHPGDMVFDANDVLYAVDETNILYTVDPMTGSRTVVGATGVTLGGLAYDPKTGTIYGSDNNDGIYTINITTGAATLVGTTGLGGNTPDILFDQAGNLFGVKSGTGGISNYISIDKTTASGIVIGSTGFVAVVGLASRVLFTPPTISCTDITSMAARCIGGLTKTIQVRVNLLNNIIHAGEEITIAIDESQYTSTIITNGTHSRANFSVPGWSVGDHAVSLVDPPGCLADKHANCVVGDDIAKADPYWDDDAEWMGTAQDVPQSSEILGNYPNPFNPSTSISYGLSEDTWVTLKIYNTIGEEVATLVNEFQPAGVRSVTWNAKNAVGSPVASGIYIYRLKAGSVVKSDKMLLMK